MDTLCLQPRAGGLDFLAGGGAMTKLIVMRNWSSTPLDSIEFWPQSLRSMVSACLMSPLPARLLWGPQRIQIFNDRYRAIRAEGHPAVLGAPAASAALGETGAPTPGEAASCRENQRLFVNRNGCLEECFFTVSSSPVRDEAGGVGGLFQLMIETTPAVLAERRAGAARALTKRLEAAETADEILGLAAAALADHARDVPFAMFYRLERLADAGFRYRLAGCAGLPAGTRLNPDFLQTDKASPWPLPDVLEGRRPMVASGLAAALAGIPRGPYPETPDRAVLVPIALPGSDLPVALMMAGVSARLPLDGAYRAFHGQVAAVVGAALAKEQACAEQRRRATALAALDQAHAVLYANLSQEFRAPLKLILQLIEDVLAEAPGAPALGRPEEDAARLFDARALKAGLDEVACLVRRQDEAAGPRRDRRADMHRTRGHEALRESERRLAFALQAGQLGSWEVDLATRQIVTSTICRTDLGLGETEALDSYDDFLSRIHPDDWAMHHAAVEEAIASRSALAVEYRVRHRDGRVTWVEIRGQAIYGADGAPARMTGVSRDVTERKQAEERQKALVDELNHRVKNTLAAVQSIAMQTLRSAESPSAFNENLTARIGALARAHDLLADTYWDGASLAEVIGKTIDLNPNAAGRCLIAADGPPVRLNPNAAVTLNLAFHELVTNAAKHGALSVQAGRVAVRWRMAPDADAPTLEIVWRETNGPSVQPPSRLGFGSRLLERALARELDGEVRLDFAPAGVCCVMRFPVSRKIAVAA